MSPPAHREIELKRLLFGERPAERLIEALGGTAQPARRQVNHVLDTDDRALCRGRHVLRLREEPGVAFLTAKGPGSDVGTSAVSRTEAEIAVDPAIASDILAGRTDPVTLLRSHLGEGAYAELWRSLEAARSGRLLRPLGHFENVRTEVALTLPSGRSLTVEVDRTRFPDGRVDEEVEIEVPDEEAVAEVEAWLDRALSRAGLESAASSSKIVRFLDALSREGTR